MHEEISTILNDIFRLNDEEIKIGTGIFLPMPKPKKPRGPVKNLRPITLLEIIRKILSKIFINRTEKKIDNYISKSQSAYRKSRSTTDIVWAHRWLAAKAQEQEITIHITGIDMSSAFNTLLREELMKIATEIFNEDETRILRVVMSETTLEVKIKEAESQQFQSNIDSPQGDSKSGPLFTLYSDKALRKLEHIQSEPIDVNDINI